MEEAEENKFSFEGKIKEKGVQIVAGCLVGKVLHIRGVNVEELRATLNKKEVKIENLRDNVFIFKFRNEADKKIILTKGPWHFNQALLCSKNQMALEKL